MSDHEIQASMVPKSQALEHQEEAGGWVVSSLLRKGGWMRERSLRNDLVSSSLHWVLDINSQNINFPFLNLKNKKDYFSLSFPLVGPLYQHVQGLGQ